MVEWMYLLIGTWTLCECHSKAAKWSLKPQPKALTPLHYSQ